MHKDNINKRAVITGATGYIGSNLTKRLIEEKWKVLLLVRDPMKIDPCYFNSSNLVVHKISKNDDFSKVFSDFKPEVVLHLASLIKGESVTDLTESNIVFGIKILQSMEDNNIKHFVNTGTYWEHYGNSNYNPVDFYAATKHAFQNIVDSFVISAGIKAITLKLHDVYGPNDKRKKILTKLIEVAISGKQLSMSPGDQKLSLVHVNDVTTGYFKAIEYILSEDYEGHQKYFLKSLDNHSLKDIVAIIEKCLGKKINANWGKIDYMERTIMEPPDVIPALPGWKPNINLSQGILSMLEESKNNKKSDQ